jgi:predicted DNA binding CopG/RHH family protein
MRTAIACPSEQTSQTVHLPLIALRISPQLLAQLRRLAAKQDKPYQTLIHDLLEKAAASGKVA